MRPGRGEAGAEGRGTAENSPLRLSSRVAMFHTRNSVLPRRYSHRITIVPRSDLSLKSGLSEMRHGFEHKRTRQRKLPDVAVVAGRHERLKERFQRHVVGKRVRGAAGDIDDVALADMP